MTKNVSVKILHSLSISNFLYRIVLITIFLILWKTSKRCMTFLCYRRSQEIREIRIVKQMRPIKGKVIVTMGPVSRGSETLT